MGSRITVRLLPPLVFAVALLSTRANAAATVVPQPIDIGPDVSLFVAVPDLSKAIDTVEAIAAQFNPKVQKGMVKMMLGMNLGDPGLGNLDASKPLVAMMFKAAPANAGDPPPFAVYIPAKAAAPYDQVAQSVQLLTSYKNGVLIVAKTQDALTLAEGQMAAYQKIADAKIAADARIFVSYTNLLSTYGPQLNAMLPMMQAGFQQGFANGPGAQNIDPQMLAKIVGLEIKGLMEFLDETDSQQLDLTLKKDAVSTESLTVAKKGSALAALFSAPPQGADKALRVLTDAGFIAGSLRMNKDGNIAFVNKLLDALAKEPEAADLLTDDMKKLVTDAIALNGGNVALSMSTAPEGGFKLQEAVTVTDEKKYAELQDQLAKLMGPDGAIGKLYANMGLKMSLAFEKAERKHGAVDVNRYKYNFDTANMPPQQAAQMKAFAKDVESALVGGVMVLGQEPADLDKMIDKALAGDAAKPDVSLEAITAFGGGKQAYFDVDFIGFMKAAMSAQPGNPAAPIMAQLKSSAPIVMAGSYDSGRVFVQSKIPLAPFVEMATLWQQFSAGGGGGQPPPAPAPDPKNDKF